MQLDSDDILGNLYNVGKMHAMSESARAKSCVLSIGLRLRQYWTPPCGDVIPFKIDNKIKYDFIRFYFSINVT